MGRRRRKQRTGARAIPVRMLTIPVCVRNGISGVTGRSVMMPELTQKRMIQLLTSVVRKSRRNTSPVQNKRIVILDERLFFTGLPP